MPAAKQSLESRIVSYFRTAPLGEAKVVFGLVREEMRARQPERPPAVKRARAAKKVRVQAVVDPRPEDYKPF